MKSRNNGGAASVVAASGPRATLLAAHVMPSTFCGFPYRNERLGGVEEVSVELRSRWTRPETWSARSKF